MAGRRCLWLLLSLLSPWSLVDPRLLTYKIKRARKVAQLLRLLDGPINHIHLSAAYCQLVTFQKCGQLVPKSSFSRLNSRLERLLSKGEVDAQGVANILWAAANLPSLPLSIIPALAASIGAGNAQDVCNTLWATARLKDRLWALAQLVEVAPEVSRVVPAIAARVSCGKAREMTPQALANSLWAAAWLHEAAVEVLDLLPAVVPQILARAGDMKAQELANSLWAAAKLQRRAPEVLEIVAAIVEEVPRQVERMNPQALSNALWASAHLQHASPEVLRCLPAIVEAIPGRAHEMNLQELCNSLWASAKLEHPEVLHLIPCLMEQVPRAGEMTPQAASNCLWAAARLQDRAREVLQVVPGAVAAVPRLVGAMSPQGLSNSLWATGHLHPVAPCVLDMLPALVAEIPRRARHMDLQELCNCLWACGQLGTVAPMALRLLPALSEGLPVRHLRPKSVAGGQGPPCGSEVKLLLHRRADVEAKTRKTQSTALMLATRKQHLECMQAWHLVAHGHLSAGAAPSGRVHRRRLAGGRPAGTPRCRNGL